MVWYIRLIGFFCLCGVFLCREYCRPEEASALAVVRPFVQVALSVFTGLPYRLERA